MKFNRERAMPNKNTFEIKPIAELIGRYYHKNSIDPFANRNKIASITNDLNPEYGTTQISRLNILTPFSK